MISFRTKIGRGTSTIENNLSLKTAVVLLESQKYCFCNTCLGTQIQEYHEDGMVQDDSRLIESLTGMWANEGYFCLCFSTVPGCVSKRSSSDTIFVRNLFKYFEENDKTANLSDIMKSVSRSIDNELKEGAKKSGENHKYVSLPQFFHP